MQKYVSSKYFNNDDVHLLASLRSRMFEVKCNFRANYFDLNCRFKCTEEETQQHIFNCDNILNKLGLESAEAQYSDIFGSTKNQKKAIEYFKKVNTILEQNPINPIAKGPRQINLVPEHPD